jgi:long-chain acyl-CoA synthetase
MAHPLPLEMLYKWEKTYPHKIYLRQPIDGVWETWTWEQAGDEVRRMAAALQQMRLPLHSNIGLLSKNCAHWIMCDLAIMMAGHVSVPLYPNLSADSIRQILEHCDAPVLFVGKLDNWSSMKPGVPDNIKCISFPFYGPTEYTPWGDLIKNNEPLKGEIHRDGNEPGTIIYTSGSTGKPKGVMHKFSNYAFASAHIASFAGLTPNERFFSYLPMAHIGERFIVEMGSLYTGGEVFFVESLETFADNLREASPTIFLGVQRIWKKLQDGVFKKLPEEKLNRLLKIPIVSMLVKRKIQKGLGLDKARIVITAAAPTPLALQLWFRKIGVKLVEGYSMTENFGYSHGILWENSVPGTVGKAMPECEVKLGDDGEVLVKNGALMDGYYKDPEQTMEAFTSDGFLKTGDMGVIDKKGYLTITGRTKDIFKTSKGKYVVPSPIEMKIGSNADIEFSCVAGTGWPQPIALVTLTENGKLKNRELLHKELEDQLQQINSALDAHEKMNKMIVLTESWTTDNNMLTPTFKIKRAEIEKKFAQHFERWYAYEDILIFEK